MPEVKNEAYLVTVTYPAGHSYKIVYLRTNWHCPFCGKTEVFECESFVSDDKSVCLSCGEDFSWNAEIGRDASETLQVVDQLKSATGV
jgi:transcription elongation factor Elf1